MMISTNFHSSNDDVDLIKIFSKLLRLKWKILKYINVFFLFLFLFLFLFEKEYTNDYETYVKCEISNMKFNLN